MKKHLVSLVVLPAASLIERQPLALWHLFPILLVYLLVLSTPSLWAQGTPPVEIPVRPFDNTVQLAPVPEAKAHLRGFSGKLPLCFDATPGSQVRFFPRGFGYYHIPINNQAALELQQPTRTAELGKAKHFIGSAPSEGLRPTYGNVHYRTIHRADDLEYYGHHIPLASSIVLRILQQGEAHPHVTAVLKLFKPQF